MMQLHTLKGYIQNIFLIEYESGCMLLDGACRADDEIISSYFKDVLKRPLKDLKVVLVTHMHPDHAGCAHYLRDKTGCKIATGSHPTHWYNGIGGRIAHITDIALAQWVAKKMGKTRRFIWYPHQLKPDIVLSQNDVIPGFEDWQIIDTPGHTSVDISIVNHKQKLMYVADLIVKIKGQLNPPFPVHFPSQYKASLAKLLDYQDYTVLMAHVNAQKVSHHQVNALIDKAPTYPQNSKQAIKRMAAKIFRIGTSSPGQ